MDVLLGCLAVYAGGFMCAGVAYLIVFFSIILLTAFDEPEYARESAKDIAIVLFQVAAFWPIAPLLAAIGLVRMVRAT